jgi:hypothetical protein
VSVCEFVNVCPLDWGEEENGVHVRSWLARVIVESVNLETVVSTFGDSLHLIRLVNKRALCPGINAQEIRGSFDDIHSLVGGIFET